MLISKLQQPSRLVLNSLPGERLVLAALKSFMMDTRLTVAIRSLWTLSSNADAILDRTLFVSKLLVRCSYSRHFGNAPEKCSHRELRKQVHKRERRYFIRTINSETVSKCHL